MKISVIHPSRNRPEQAYNTFRNWTEKAEDLDSIEYILSFDSDQRDIYANTFINFQHKIVGLNGPNKSAIQAINTAAYISYGDLLIVISDDFDCPEHWDTLLLQQLAGRKDYVAKTNDGLQPTLITMPVMDRTYYERYGYVYHPDYLHMFCDQELTAVAIMKGKYIKLPLTFEHLHYSTGKTAKDALNIKNDHTWGQGEALFNERLKSNFGIEGPVVNYSDIKWH